jgi:hypothetical protein
MQASERFVYESYACAGRSKEELVIISVKVSIEGGQLSGRQVRIVRWLVVFVLETVSPRWFDNLFSGDKHTMTFFSPLSSAFSLSVPVLSGLNIYPHASKASPSSTPRS